MSQKAADWLKDKENLFFGFLIILHIVPLWYFKYIPSQDGPAYLYNANILRHLLQGGANIFKDYFNFNPSAVLSWNIHYPMALLMLIFPALIVEKIVLSAYVILLPLSFYLILQKRRPESKPLAVLIFPFVYNFHLHMGFYPFCVSLFIFFFGLLYWLGMFSKPLNLKKTLFFMAISFLLACLHPVSWGMLALAVAALIVISILSEIFQHHFENTEVLAAYWNHLVASLFSLLPAFIFLISIRYEAKIRMILGLPFQYSFRNLIDLVALVSFSQQEVQAAKIYALILAVLAVYAGISKMIRKDLNPSDSFLFVLFAYCVVYFSITDFAPPMLVTTFFGPRMILYIYFAALLWLCLQSYNRWEKNMIRVFGLAVTLLFFFVRFQDYAKINPEIEKYLSAQAWIKPDTTLAPLSYASRGKGPQGDALSIKVAPFLHLSGYLGAMMPVFVFDNFQAASGRSPVSFHNPVNNVIHSKIENGSFSLDDISEFERQSGRKMDYLLIWYPADSPVLRDFQSRYGPVKGFPASEKLELYERNK